MMMTKIRTALLVPGVVLKQSFIEILKQLRKSPEVQKID